MRLEGHHAHGQIARARGLADTGEQRLVAAVDTVEVADRQRAGRAAFGVGKTAEDSHDSRWGGRRDAAKPIINERAANAAKQKIINAARRARLAPGFGKAPGDKIAG
jgi:hypothetical protein